MRILRSAVVALVLAACVSTLPAQTPQRSNEVTGYKGDVRILPNAAIGQTTVVLSSPTLASGQIVFVLQENRSALPSAWSGRARILAGDGFLGVVPLDSSAPQWLSMFSDRSTPPSLQTMRLHPYSIIGIARYGETVPLSNAQIDCLASRGAGCHDLKAAVGNAPAAPANPGTQPR
jgi:hypothetical protein